MSKSLDYYKILQIDCEAEPEVVTAAYRRLAAKYHPDVNKASDADERMRDLNQAYAVINDPAKRSEYDRQRAARAKPARTTASHSSYYATRRSAPMVTITPSVLAFGCVPVGTTRTLTIEISVTEGRAVIGDVRTTHPWIHPSATRLFNSSSVVNIEVDTTGLKEGSTHSGAVVFISITYGTRSVPVTLQVGAPLRPVLVATPSMLDFGNMVSGRSPKAVSMRLSNGGPGLLSGTLRSRQKWLSLSEATWSGNQAVVQAIADPSGLKPGRVYEGEIEVASNGGHVMILARMHVVAADVPFDVDTAKPAPTRDLDFLRERMLILQEVKRPTAMQESEHMVISHLLQVCKGGDVAVTLQRAIEGAQGWREQAYLAEGVPLSQNLLPVLTDLFQRLRRWETHEG